jgi:hypothetical protein
VWCGVVAIVRSCTLVGIDVELVDVHPMADLVSRVA